MNLRDRLEELRPVRYLLNSGRRDVESGRLFGQIRWRLTLMFTSMLAAALILSGIILYLSVQNSLLAPVNGDLKTEGAYLELDWQGQHDPTEFLRPCPLHAPPEWLVACYGPHGKLLSTNDGNTDLAAFNSPSLAKSVTGGGSRIDTVITGASGNLKDYSSIQRYAVRVPHAGDAPGNGILQVGVPIGSQVSTLTTLLHLLLVLGILTLVFSAVMGLFLANRALLPARIAYARQRDFIADASHELRTPLTMLRSSIEFVLRNPRDLREDHVALLEDTVQEAVHLTTLANNMLDLAQLDSDTLRIERDIVDLHEMAGDVVRWSASAAAERNVQVELTGQESTLVLGDRSLLQQSMIILVDNAVKYNRDGGHVGVDVSHDNDQAMLTVTDSGIGISPEHVGRLGERFYRVDKARSRESGGAGLGLSIVRSIMSRHGGTISIQSTIGEGTSVQISLPLLHSRLPPPEDTGEAAEDDRGELSKLPGGPTSDVS